MLKPRKMTSSTVKAVQTLPLDECLAKTVSIAGGNFVKPGINVFLHCLLTGLVAREILNRIPDWLKEAIFPPGSEFVVAVHDIGKIWHVFQEKIYRALRTEEYKEGRKLDIANPDLEKMAGYHWTVGQAAIAGTGKYLSEIVGRHHGCMNGDCHAPDAEIYGGIEWQELRVNLIESLKKELQTDWPAVQSPIGCDVLTGLTCVSDWISSGAFSEKEQVDITAVNELQALIVNAVDSAGLILPSIQENLTFQSVFGFTAHQLQIEFIDCIDRKGVYILEAPMGTGKTEAALYAAYKCLEKKIATGVYFALPTQLTSDKMHERMNWFLKKILKADSPSQSALLLHGAAWLKKTEFGEEGAPGNSWFNSLKRGILAPFAVGTVDQALMAAMNVKHGFVRTFGLAGKVVILDEIHSYDMYTGTLLDSLVKVLLEIQCTVIILSATLTASRRQELLNTQNAIYSTSYPLISKKVGNSPVKEVLPGHTGTADVHINIVHNDAHAFDEALLRAEQGQQVLWIENTIGEAQATYKRIGARASNIGIDYGLLHSRYIKKDREQLEKKWVDLFGKSSGKSRKECGRILVGTQILEQSLDIDADFLVTRLCPSDMLFQRIGRLWRHPLNDTLRPVSAQREAWILSPRFEDILTEKGIFGKSGIVYEPYLLCRTMEVWNGKSVVNLPKSIPVFLNETYANRLDTGLLADYKTDLESKRDTLRRLALIGVSRAVKTLPEEKASTRHSDYGSIDILLVRSRSFINNFSVNVRFLDDSEITFPIEGVQNKRKQRNIAAELLRNTVRVPSWVAPDVSLQQMKWLKNYIYIGNDNNEVVFRAALVQSGGDICGLGHENPFNGYQVSYSPDMGYLAIKQNYNEFD